MPANPRKAQVLLCSVFIWLGVVSLLYFQIREMSLSQRVNDTLEVLAEALEGYRQDKGSFVKLNEASGVQLVKFLVLTRTLAAAPDNPVTRQPYLKLPEEPDFFHYRTGPDFQSYTLTFALPGSSGPLAVREAKTQGP